MQNVRLNEAQTGIKIVRRNINNLRYADDTTLMAESEELKRLLMKVKEESEKSSIVSHLYLGSTLRYFLYKVRVTDLGSFFLFFFNIGMSNF